MNDLFKKNKRFMSDDLRENNFRNFPEADTLFLPNFLKLFIIFCDASNKAKVFIYLMGKINNCGQFLSDSEGRYCATDKELLSVH